MLKENFLCWGALGTLSLGSFLSGLSDTPTTIKSFFGYILEANYRFNNKISAFSPSIIFGHNFN
jgi:hypothetical protein